MKKPDLSNEREQWIAKNRRAMGSNKLPFEEGEEPLSVPLIVEALMDIRESKSRALKPASQHVITERLFDPANIEEVERPHESAVWIITRALREGVKGEKLLKQALDLKPRARGAILARNIARKLTKPIGGWPKEDDEEGWDHLLSGAVEWHKPTKSEVERELEHRYPEVYESLPRKDGSGGKLLRSAFWKEAGLKDVIGQARGYR